MITFTTEYHRGKSIYCFPIYEEIVNSKLTNRKSSVVKCRLILYIYLETVLNFSKKFFSS